MEFDVVAVEVEGEGWKNNRHLQSQQIVVIIKQDRDVEPRRIFDATFAETDVGISFGGIRWFGLVNFHSRAASRLPNVAVFSFPSKRPCEIFRDSVYCVSRTFRSAGGDMDITGKAYDEGYSPSISATLILAGQQFEVGSLGPTEISLRNARPMPAGSGAVHVKVADSISIYHIELPEGIDPSRLRQPCCGVAIQTDAAA